MYKAVEEFPSKLQKERSIREYKYVSHSTHSDWPGFTTAIGRTLLLSSATVTRTRHRKSVRQRKVDSDSEKVDIWAAAQGWQVG